MRSDLNILWIDDTKTFYDNSESLFKMWAEDDGISLEFTYEEKTDELFDKIDHDANRFKIYDICFVDYALSNGVLGNSVINKLRELSVDADILFYSSEHEEAIKDIMVKNLIDFQGVYIANRLNFNDKAYYLIKKNARKLLSINNIRGAVMDKTAENDYTVKSYLLQKFNELNEDQKTTISRMVQEYIDTRIDDDGKIKNRSVISVQKCGSDNIEKILKLPTYFVPLKIQYKIFQQMLNYLEESADGHEFIDEYLKSIVEMRNNLAHRKLELCKQQTNIIYYDNIMQKKDLECPEDCTQHKTDNRISAEEWEKRKKDMIRLNKQFDQVQTKLQE